MKLKLMVEALHNAGLLKPTKVHGISPTIVLAWQRMEQTIYPYFLAHIMHFLAEGKYAEHIRIQEDVYSSGGLILPGHF